MNKRDERGFTRTENLLQNPCAEEGICNLRGYLDIAHTLEKRKGNKKAMEMGEKA